MYNAQHSQAVARNNNNTESDRFLHVSFLYLYVLNLRTVCGKKVTLKGFCYGLEFRHGILRTLITHLYTHKSSNNPWLSITVVNLWTFLRDHHRLRRRGSRMAFAPTPQKSGKSTFRANIMNFLGILLIFHTLLFSGKMSCPSKLI